MHTENTYFLKKNIRFTCQLRISDSFQIKLAWTSRFVHCKFIASAKVLCLTWGVKLNACNFFLVAEVINKESTPEDVVAGGTE